jgi:uncharacterized membrane protein YiaA
MREIITFQPVDWIIMLFYGAVIFTVGIFVIRKPATTEGYFLAGRKRQRLPAYGSNERDPEDDVGVGPNARPGPFR